MILVAVQLIILFHPFSIFCLWSAKGARAHCWLHTWTCNVLWLDSCELSRMFQAFSNDVSMTRNPKACAIHLRNSLRSCGFLSAPIFSLAPEQNRLFVLRTGPAPVYHKIRSIWGVLDDAEHPLFDSNLSQNLFKPVHVWSRIHLDLAHFPWDIWGLDIRIPGCWEYDGEL